MKPLAAMSPRFVARIGGLQYLLIFITAPSGAESATPVKMLLNLAADVGVAVTLWYLFQPVSGRLSLYASLCRLVFVVVMTFNSLSYFGVLNVLPVSHSAASFNDGYGIALIPFGVHCALTGYLIFRSTFLPRLLGILMMVAGFAYLILLWPSLGQRLFFPYIVVPAVIGEASLMLWLLVMGVNDTRWTEHDESGTRQ